MECQNPCTYRSLVVIPVELLPNRQEGFIEGGFLRFPDFDLGRTSRQEIQEQLIACAPGNLDRARMAWLAVFTKIAMAKAIFSLGTKGKEVWVLMGGTRSLALGGDAAEGSRGSREVHHASE